MRGDVQNLPEQGAEQPGLRLKLDPTLYLSLL